VTADDDVLAALREQYRRTLKSRRDPTPDELEAAEREAREAQEGAQKALRQAEERSAERVVELTNDLLQGLVPERPVGPVEVVVVERSKARRHRPPDQLEAKVVRRCEAALKKRAKAGKPRTGPLTLDAIATRVQLPRARVTQAEQLLELGWPLLRTHPDFSADEGYVRWPSPREAALLLRLG
jgi:hypothetical protein